MKFTKNNFIRILKQKKIYFKFISEFYKHESFSFRKNECVPMFFDEYVNFFAERPMLDEQIFISYLMVNAFNWNDTPDGYFFWRKFF